MGLKREIVRTLLAGAGIIVACSAGGRGKNQVAQQGARQPTGAAGSSSDATNESTQPRVDPPGNDQPTTIGTMLDSAGDVISELVPEAKAQSGSRLKARWNVGDDGSRQFVNWYDSELDAECYFTTAADGQLRCLPYSGAASPLGYRDAGCSSRVFGVVQSACVQAAAPKFGLEAACGYKLFQLANQVQLSDVYSGTPANCVRVAPAAGYTYYAAGAEIPASRFVAGHVDIDN